MKKHRLNWIDGLVAALVLLMVIGAVYKFRGNNVTSGAVPMQPVSYTVRVSDVRSGMVEALREGDTVYDVDSGNPVGTIAAVAAEAARTTIPQPDGTVRWGTVEERYDVELTLEAEATVTGETCMVNRIYQLNVGSLRSFYSKYASWTGRITAVEA